MKKIVIFAFIILMSGAAAAQHDVVTVQKHKSEFSKNRPKPNEQQRLERRSPAYKKSVSQAAANPDEAEESLCYYTMSGCSEDVLSKNDSLLSIERKPLRFPKQGYLLGNDGMYHFKSNAMSRN